MKKKKPEKPTDYAIFGRELIDMETIRQMDTAMKLPIVVKGALMADAHLGYGLPIGGVVAAYNAVMPYGVGMDIGCRMCLSIYEAPESLLTEKREFIKKTLKENTRFGLAEFHDLGDQEIMERKEFRDIAFIRSLKDQFYAQLGSSGHGNHFVDIGFVEVWQRTADLDLDPGNYLAILSHSGSRYFGAEVARHYTRIAQAKLGLSGEGARLAWLDLDSEEGQEYWQAMTLAGDYAAANHRIIHQKFSGALAMQPMLVVENHHNFAWVEEISSKEKLVIHRKGATPARKGDLGVIPGSMASPAFIVSGKGNEASLESASHGAGRSMSRNQARKTFSRKRIDEALAKEGVELIGGGTDEAPSAYKDIFSVMQAQKDQVSILGKFHPRIVRME